MQQLTPQTIGVSENVDLSKNRIKFIPRDLCFYTSSVINYHIKKFQKGTYKS